MKLTKMADVVTVIRGGGHVRKMGQGALLSLHDADGKEISAWQNAIKAAVTLLRYTPREFEECADVVADLASIDTGTRRFLSIRARLKELDEYFHLTGRSPPRFCLEPQAYEAALRCVNDGIRVSARTAARDANERRKAEKQRGPRIKPVIVPATGLSWRGIPIVEGPAYSKHRPFDFTPLPTTS
ncbi:hypothetical protein LR961_19075, partial [Stenotrophomonas sp. SY1]|nr:hypothetical protein [Stenotrophomonas sp. SY1]